MALTSWKSFKFFEVSEVKLPESERTLLSDQGGITCVTTGSDNVFFGSSDGVVRILSQAFKVARSFKAYDSTAITHMKQVQGTALLVTIAEDLSTDPVLKLWALDKIDKRTGAPRCQTTIHIRNGGKRFPISAFDALEDLSQLAVGFANGAVTVVRGNLIHDLGNSQRTVFESEEPITGIEFRVGNAITLCISTTSRISMLAISGKGQGQPARTLDESGCGVGCLALDPNTRELVVAREDAIHYYGPRGRGPSFAYECPKKSVHIHNDYVVIVSPPQSNTLPRSAPMRTFGGTAADDLFSTSNFTILNTDLKFIAHQESLRAEVKAVFMEWNDIFVLTTDGKLYRYHEKSLQQKLELLYQRNLYVLAINLVQKLGVDRSQQNVIYRKYGDYLYQRQDYDTAMQQYLKAIDNTEPSQVIRKFLDTQRIHNLIDYLEELHEHHRATADHTTLLLNCYAKLKDVEKLEEFIKSPGDLKFDLDTAIAMCRQGGYFDQAAYLARKHEEHELVVDILIEDSKRYAEAIAYIWRLEPETAFKNFMRFATVLLENCPQDTTKLFLDYYTGQYKPKKDAVVVTNNPTPTSYGLATTATTAVQNLAALLPLPYMNTSTVQSPSSASDQQTTVSQAHIVETNADDPPADYDIPKPRSAFPAFVDHPEQFVVFLEACVKSDDVKDEDRVDLYTTLFEMYLHKASSLRGDDKKAWEDKARELVDDKKIPMETSNVLLLSDLENFKEGSTLVREQEGLYFDIFRSYTRAKDTAGAIKALRKYGPEEPQLYPAALQYFTSSEAIMHEAGAEFETVLNKIDDDGLMAPLQVIQTLSTNGIATMGMIKKYLSKSIDREQQEITSNRRLIHSFRADTETKRGEIEELTNNPATFKVTRCSICGGTLDLPAVHFMCKHSFHKRCLNIQDDAEEQKVECPVCAPQNATVRAIRKAQEESADRHDMFLDALARSRNKFEVITEWYGRGVMSAPTPE
ncbi:vacuolar protein sorting protein-like protein [Eremomyces bilateralis CBS 781.70]|uniref:E3 ubiquitin-protein ligase PEP5 n=1 Tax=Eremomyces bilateralis CBS 781.70 TaxID=1392243 RepID=A0A6G1GGM4_9PEZI|nr:vacuolar protein sorting protein-like protein [Eremomyces bilateralis CBS 781.70]KAF1817203.1 vacuolar protein sorting protein-like protein [Eremomyces bilateralis CBS 781.70]